MHQTPIPKEWTKYINSTKQSTYSFLKDLSQSPTEDQAKWYVKKTHHPKSCPKMIIRKHHTYLTRYHFPMPNLHYVIANGKHQVGLYYDAKELDQLL